MKLASDDSPQASIYSMVAGNGARCSAYSWVQLDGSIGLLDCERIIPASDNASSVP